MKLSYSPKYLLIAAISLLVIFLIAKQISYVLFSKQYTTTTTDKFKLLIIWTHGLGERELIARYIIAAKNIDIEYRSVSATLHDNLVEKLIGDLPKVAIDAYKPDAIIMLQNQIAAYPGARNYRVLDTNHSKFIVQNSYGKYVFKSEYLKGFDGYLAPFPRLDLIGAACANCNKEFHGLAWYPTSHRVHYPAAEPKLLFYNGGSGVLRNSEKYQTLFRLLINTGYLKMISDAEYKKILNIKQEKFKHNFIKSIKWKESIQAANEMVPFDGVALIKAHHEAGISLLLHSEHHLPFGVPTGRIFEAAAANTVIISDENAFVREYFGENVLYIDVTQDAQTIFKQIDQHMQWIFSHPNEAKIMAQNCHDVFLEKFTLEDQILRLIAMHNSI